MNEKICQHNENLYKTKKGNEQYLNAIFEILIPVTSLLVIFNMGIKFKTTEAHKVY